MSDPNAVLADISSFNKEQMKHVEVAEKSVLPDKDQVEFERQEAELRQAIERGEHQLNHVEVAEKSVLPDAGAIAQEKQEQQLLLEIQASRELKHVEVQERNPLPDAEAIQQEKAAIGDAAE